MNLHEPFNIPFNDEGKTFIRVLRQVVKQNGGSRVKLRGRGHRRGVDKYRQDLPLRFASSVRVYVES